MPSEFDPQDKLQRLLALKRHEAPPPGFFEAFPDRVRARILAEVKAPAPGWWERLAVGRFWRPALAGACATLAAGLWIWQAGQRPHSTTGQPLAGEAGAAPQWVESSLTPATASGPFPGTRTGPGLSSGRVPLDSVPPGLFAPGAGLRGSLVPVAATGVHSGITVTGLHAAPSWQR
jgi:hypothetical protein